WGEPAAAWRSVKRIYSGRIADREDRELAETFFNSVTLRLVPMTEVDRRLIFVSSAFEDSPSEPVLPVHRTYKRRSSTKALVLELLGSYRFDTPFDDLDRDASLIARA